MSNALLEFKNVSVNYGGIQALRGVSFTIPEGEIVTVLGSNGAGKTSTLRAISGTVALKGGEVLYRGEPLSAWSHKRPHQVAGLGIAHVPEGRGIFPELTIDENLDLGAWAQKDKKQIERDRERVFTFFPRLKERRTQPGGNLSGGEQQMLAIGRALMSHPKLLLLDEPSLGLAPQVISLIFKIVQEINRDGTTVLLVEQNAHLALAIAHKGIVLETGELTLVDVAANLLNNPKIREAYLGNG
ncbi:MAG: ABC transporter ATP-binding protein [Proteobacteria bacterium]|nr:MAG: ABC transporter ATP-binding protein [Pseudomonadota bacterium]